MRNDIPRPLPGIWLCMDTKEWRKLVALLAKSIATTSSSKKKFLAWHRARLTPLVDLELDAHGHLIAC
jgi:hypothetical protein